METLKQEIADNTTGGISFIEIYEVYPEVEGEKKRVVMFQILAAATAIPTGWKNHYYGRNGESLGALSVEELDRIRGQDKKDWSKQIIEGATIEHIDKDRVSSPLVGFVLSNLAFDLHTRIVPAFFGDMLEMFESAASGRSLALKTKRPVHANVHGTTLDSDIESNHFKMHCSGCGRNGSGQPDL